MTIHLKVELMPFLRRKQTETILNLELPDVSKVEDVLSELGFSGEEMHSLTISVNNKLVHLGEILKDNDNIWVGLISGGG